MAKIGAHVSAAGSIDLSFQRAQHIGAQATQIFISPPQQWLKIDQTTKSENYRIQAQDTKISPNFIHATYLVNLGTQNPEHLKKSIDWLSYALKTAAELEVDGVIVHIGSHKGRGFDTILEQVTESIRIVIASEQSERGNLQNEIASSSPKASPRNDGKPYLILENCAGSGGTIGQKFSELGAIIKAVNNPQVKVCLDTQHAFAAGYDLRTPVTLKEVLAEFDQEIGLDKLVVIHANDSKTELGSNKDRHENIGEGFIGKEGFKNILNHPKLKDLPFILEVPGFADTGPDKENVDLLKSLINP